MISPQPDIRTLEIDPDQDSWMILACDGIWNFMSSQEVVDYIQQKINVTPNNKLSSICEEVSQHSSPPAPPSGLTTLFPFQLFEHCLAPDTMGDGTGCDNMTAVIVKFKPGFITVKNIITNGSTVSSNGGSKEQLVNNGSQVREEEPASKRQKLDCDASESSS